MCPRMERGQLMNLSSLALAHMGDAVYELLIRTKLCTEGLLTSDGLHRRTVELVCAAAQARVAHVLAPLLTEEEQQVFRRGRNAKPRHVPHTVSPDEYGLATALEALLGYLYLAGRQERIDELFRACAGALQKPPAVPAVPAAKT